MRDDKVERGSGEIELTDAISIYATYHSLGPAYSGQPEVEDPDNVPHYYGNIRGQVIDHIPDDVSKDPAAIAEAKDWADHLRRKPN